MTCRFSSGVDGALRTSEEDGGAMREVDELGVADLVLRLEIARDVPDCRLIRLALGPLVEDMRHEGEVGGRWPER